MRLFSFLLTVILCVMVMGCDNRKKYNAPKPEYRNPHNEVKIYISPRLVIDEPNRILLKSLKILEKVVIQLTSHYAGLTVFEKPSFKSWSGRDGYLYELSYQVPIQFKPGSRLILKFQFFNCPGNFCEGSKQWMDMETRISVRMVRHYTYILGETDKPVYRPGENVKFRFVALTRRNLVPTTEALSWPKYQALGDYWNSNIEKIRPEDYKRRIEAPYFDWIEIKDPINNLVQQWKNVKILEALNLSYSLISDAAEGEWKIAAYVQDEMNEIIFQVRHYVLPRFQAQVSVPSVINLHDMNLTVYICASYTNGPAMSGIFDAQICICDKREISRQQDAKELMPKNECKRNYESVTRQCMRFNGELDSSSACSNFTVDITGLVGDREPGLNDKLGVFVEVSEDATGLSIVVSNTAEIKTEAEPKFVLEMPSTFKPGFPVVGQITVQNNGKYSEDLQLIVHDYSDSVCLRRYFSVEPGRKSFKFVLPPPAFKETASIVLRQINERFNPPSISRKLSLWDGNFGFAFRVRAMKSKILTCPETARLLVFTNERIPENTIMMLHFLNIGKLETVEVLLRPEYASESTDYAYDRYECEESDRRMLCPQRELFKYTAHLQLYGMFNPKLRAVAIIGFNGKQASDYVQFENIQSCSTPSTSVESSRMEEGIHFSKKYAAPGEAVNVTLKVPQIQGRNSGISNTCLLRTMDVATRNFSSPSNKMIDFEAITDILERHREQGDRKTMRSLGDAYREAGIIFDKVFWTPPPPPPPPREGARMVLSSSVVKWPKIVVIDEDDDRTEDKLELADNVSKPRLRDFFPEIWLFEAVALTNGTYEKILTVPDSLTSWEANAVCFLEDRSLWATEVKPTLTVRMPFFVEFAPPIVVKRGEIIHLPITIFLHPDENSDNVTCYEAEMRVNTDPKDWRIVGASNFSACICSSKNGQQTKETFRLQIRALRVGQLNLTATAIAKRGAGACDDKVEKEKLVVSDAVRRSIRVEPEGVEKRYTVGGIFCSNRRSRKSRHELKIELPHIDLVNSSLRSYVAVGGSVLSRALSNLDSLVQMPTGCGEQNLVKVAPSVYVLKYLLSFHNATSLHQVALARKAAGYITTGFKNELKYRHPNGAFSTFGPKYGANGSTWLTAYVFEVFSEAVELQMSNIDAQETLREALDFLMTMQDSRGCFIELGERFISTQKSNFSAEKKLQLTSHVLSALSSSTNYLRFNKGFKYSEGIRKAIECIESNAESWSLNQWPTILLAKVLYAMKKSKSPESESMMEALVEELESRSKKNSTLYGSFKWWPDSETQKSVGHFNSRVQDLENTAYALLALSPESISSEDQVAVMKWISQQQNDKGGFYSTQDTVVTLRALIESANSFPTITEKAIVKVHDKDLSLVNLRLEISPENLLVSNTHEIGYHNDDIKDLTVQIESPNQACVSIQFTSIYNVPDTQNSDNIFAMDVTVDQGGSDDTARCTVAHTTVCLGLKTLTSTGMLLVTIQPPSGWTVINSELKMITINGNLQRLDFDAENQKVFAYLRGFENEEVDSAKRCFSFNFHQRNYIENLKLGIIAARDYYNPTVKLERFFELNSCQRYWESTSKGFEDVTIEKITTPSTKGPKLMCLETGVLENTSAVDEMPSALL